MTKEFSSFAGFATHLMAMEAAVKTAEHHSLKKVAQLVEDTAKAEIGHYQAAVGPFPAWAPLAESTEEQKAAKGYPAGAPLLGTGEMRDNITHQVEGEVAVIGSPDERMVYHEFGTSKMPPRPVLGPAVFSNKAKIEKIIGKAVVAGLLGGQVVAGSSEYFLGE